MSDFLETVSVVERIRRRWVDNRVVSNVLVLLLAYVVYLSLRYTILGNVETRAFANADAVIGLERALGIFVEADIQAWMLDHVKWAVIFFNWFYSLGFFPVILPVAAVLFVTRPDTFTYYRNVFLISIVITWTLYSLYPLAPPRLLPEEGFVDAIAVLGPDFYSSKESQDFYNAYSAMPSMHFGWPLLYGVMLFRTGNPWLRVTAFVYPGLLFAAVIVTANHYFVDPLAGALVVLVSFKLRSLLSGRAAGGG